MSSKRKKTGRVFRKALFVLTTVLTFAGLFSFLVFSFGRVDGTEFSPHQFSRRNFTYYQIPIVQLQITPVVRSSPTHDLEDYLSRQKILVPATTANRWDPINTYSGSAQINGDAKILCNYLDTTNSHREFVWLDWTKDEKNEKKIGPFWSAVHQAANLNAYFVIPSLFQVAKKPLDAEAFETELHNVARQQYFDAATDYASVNESDIAEKLFAAAREHEVESRENAEQSQQTNRKKVTN